MKYYKLANGDNIPSLGLGTWKSEKKKVYQAVKDALKIGYRHIDCAAIYGNEQEIGQALNEAIASKEVKREDLWITSKLWSNAHEEKHVIPALKKTLSDLQLDYLDLYLIHWPVAFKKELIFPQKGEDFKTLEEVPIAQTWKAMEQAAQQGLCKHLGVSNFSQKKLGNLIAEASKQPEVNQIESHPYLQQKDLLTYCRSKGVLVTAYSPLGSADRVDSLKKKDKPSLMEHPLIKEIADKHKITPAQILLAWGINRDTVVIPKSVNQERLQENFAAADIVLSSEEMEAIKDLDLHFRFVDGSFWEIPGSPYTVSNLWDE